VAQNLTPAQVRAYRLLDNRKSPGNQLGRGSCFGLEFLDLKEMH